MKKRVTVFTAIFLLFCSTLAFSQNYAVGLKAETRGFGLDFIRSFGESVNVGVGFSYFGITIDGGDAATDEYTYEADAKLTSFNIFADWYFIENSILRLTGGVVINLNEADIDMLPAKTYTVGGDVYSPEMLGTMNANIKFNPVAPYIGFGIGNPTQTESAISFTFDIGTFYQGGSIVDLEATKLLTPSASEDQEALIEDNLDWFQFYPVLKAGVYYKF